MVWENHHTVGIGGLLLASGAAVMAVQGLEQVGAIGIGGLLLVAGLGTVSFAAGPE